MKNGLINNAGHLPGFTDSAEDELQYCFSLSNAMIDHQMQNAMQFDKKTTGNGVTAVSDVQFSARQLRLRLLQEMLLEQVPSLRHQIPGAQ